MVPRYIVAQVLGAFCGALIIYGKCVALPLALGLSRAPLTLSPLYAATVGPSASTTRSS